MSCDFTVDVRIVSIDGVTTLASLQDEAAGYELVEDIAEPNWREDDGPVESPYMHGDAPSRLPTKQPGTLPVQVEITGPTWRDACLREDVLVAAWESEPRFYLDVETEAYTRRYLARREDFQSAPVSAESIHYKTRRAVLVFRVQPNPVVT